jgi:branched-chain amino acid transport system substrate-binding protein
MSTSNLPGARRLQFLTGKISITEDWPGLQLLLIAISPCLSQRGTSPKETEMQRWIAGCFAALAISLAPIPAAKAEMRIGIAAPLTGPRAWAGEETRAGAEAAVRDLNDRGGILGEALVTVLVDDFCDAEQAVAAAKKLVVDGVPFVVGHQCSGAAIPASEIYETADIIFISPKATNPRLTDRGLKHTFRTCGRDDLQGKMVGDHIARKWSGADIAIVHDGQTYGQGVAEEVKRRLGELGIKPALLEQVNPGHMDLAQLVSAIRARGIDVVFYGGYSSEAGLLVRETKSRAPDVAFIVPDGVAREDFWMVAGDAAEGTRMTQVMNAMRHPAAADVVADLMASGTDPAGAELYAYAAVQVWAQAVEVARTTSAARVAQVLRAQRFSTVIGIIGFDENGDVIGIEPFTWYVWTRGTYVQKDLIE